jgi:glycosyltransferase involved in cell wall biosynthesis
MEKVLFLAKSREFGGLEIVLLDWLSLIDYSKVSVVVCCYGTETLKQRLAATSLPIEFIDLKIADTEPSWKTFSKWRRLFSSIAPAKTIILEAVLSEFDATPVLAARLSNAGRISLFEANWGREVQSAWPMKKRNFHYGFLPGIGLYRHKETLRQRVRGWLAHHTFVVSQGIKDNLVSHYDYPAAKTSVLYHGVDSQRFVASAAERAEFRQLQGIPADATVIVSHGRLVPRKRVDRILKAFEVLSREQTNLWLLLTCYGPLKDDIERIAAASQACPRIKLVGFQDDSSLTLKAADIYVLSSNDEGFGIALLEAMSSSLVCVATSGPGPRDIITDSQNGFLVEPSDEGILLGLRRALSLNQEAKAKLVRRARQTVVDRFEISAAIPAALQALQIPRR